MTDKPSESEVEDWVRQRAFDLWDRAGRPEGRDAEFRDQATDEITAELLEDQDRTIRDKDDE